MSVYKRGGIWWVKFRRDGRTIRESSGSSIKRVAEKYERELKEEYARIRRGGKPRMTFDDMMARFVSEHFPNLKPQSARRYFHSIKNLRTKFGDMYLNQINKSALSDYVSSRRKLVSTSTIRRDLACLSSAMECAVGWDWCDANPVRSFNKRTIPEGKARTRYLTEDEFMRLRAASKPYMAPAIEFAVATGMRLEEQLSLTWDRVNLFRREATLVDTKGGTPRIVPLSDKAMAVLLANPQHFSSPYVFHKGDGSRYHKFTRGLAAAAKRGGIKDLQWHDLRRTFGSWKLQSGVDIFTVSRLLGHKSVATTQRSYAFLDIESLHRLGTKVARGHADNGGGVG